MSNEQKRLYMLQNGIVTETQIAQSQIHVYPRSLKTEADQKGLKFTLHLYTDKSFEEASDELLKGYTDVTTKFTSAGYSVHSTAATKKEESDVT